MLVNNKWFIVRDVIEMEISVCYTVLIEIRTVLLPLKRVLLKQKNWLAAKTKKEMHRRQRINNRKRRAVASHHSHKKSHSVSAGKHVLYVHAPVVLSVFESPKDTLNFFKETANAIKELKFKERLYFDLSKIEAVTVDAIMYLIAFIKNTRKLKTLQIECAGNMPANEQARTVFETCGFYQYVSPQYNLRKVNKSDHINITQGHEADPILAGQICDFVHAHSAYGRLETKSLFTMIMELMANTKQHAYNDNCHMENNWYVFVEDNPAFLNFVFLDTGEGIPKTIYTKGLVEKIKSAFNSADAFFIASALRGELRSETGLCYRGKGLPEIYQRAASNYIKDFSIISGYGHCSIEQDGSIKETSLRDALSGTMLCWKLSKRFGG